MINIFKLLFVFIVAFFISGCLTKTLPPVKSYYLTNDSKCCEKTFETKPLTVQIIEPMTNKYLNTTSIFYSENKYELHEYKLSKWSDYPTKMIHDILLSHLDNLNLFENVITDTVHAKADYILQGELFDLKQIIEDNSSYVLFKIKFYFIEVNDAKKVKSKTFNYKVKTKTVDAKGAIHALNEASNLMLKDLSIWLSKI